MIANQSSVFPFPDMFKDLGVQLLLGVMVVSEEYVSVIVTSSKL